MKDCSNTNKNTQLQSKGRDHQPCFWPIRKFYLTGNQQARQQQSTFLDPTWSYGKSGTGGGKDKS